MATSSSPLISPNSDKRFWSALRNRVDTLLESRNSSLPSSVLSMSDGDSTGAKRMKEDSMLLIRGFDSISQSLSQLTGTLDNALQGTRDLAKAPTLTEIVHSCTSHRIEKEESEEREVVVVVDGERKGVKKRKIGDLSNKQGDGVQAAVSEKKKEDDHKQKLKNLAISMASKSTSLARELKSIKSELTFTKERCAMLEEENCRLREGFGKGGIRPDEDDLVRLQLEALLAEKSRLATENANLTRENQCLRQLVEYHQFATNDLSASYEELVIQQGLCLDFSSPIAEERKSEGEFEEEDDDKLTPGTTVRVLEFHNENSSIDDQSFDAEKNDG